MVRREGKDAPTRFFAAPNRVSGIGVGLEETHFLDKSQQAEIGHALRIEHAVEMIGLVLAPPRVEAGRLALDGPSIGSEAAITDSGIAAHGAAQAGDRQAAFPSLHGLVVQ